MHSCTKSEQREKPARKITKSITFFSQMSRGPRPPEGAVKCGIKAGRRRESKRETEKRGHWGGGGQNKDIPHRGSCGSTSKEAPPAGYTQVLDSQTENDPSLSSSCHDSVHLTKGGCCVRNKHLVDGIRRRHPFHSANKKTHFNPPQISSPSPCRLPTHPHIWASTISWTKMSEIRRFFFQFYKPFPPTQVVCPFWGGNRQLRQRWAGPFHETGAIPPQRKPRVVCPCVLVRHYEGVWSPAWRGTQSIEKKLDFFVCLFVFCHS